MLTALCVATLNACATSSKASKLAIAADPVGETRTVTRLVCPAELSAASPATVPYYVGPPIDIAQAALDWMAAHFRREDLLARRLSDARTQCP
ncbi:hypothetical protein BH09PSE4_BH09PSE4_21240 [soil metagenome]